MHKSAGKTRCAIIGSGNIGMNLLFKLEKSVNLECALLVGRNKQSRNLSVAKSKGYQVAWESLESLICEQDQFDIVFDATSSDAHYEISREMRKLGKTMIDLTPAKCGKLCIPCLNGEECISEREVNMVTCGGQSMVPLAYAIAECGQPIEYLESVSTIASKSAGVGTRDNIDDYIETTQFALKQFTGVENTKAMIVLNPTDPPMVMHNTLYAVIKKPDMEQITHAVQKYEKKIQQYVPGYALSVLPTLIEDHIVAVSVYVKGSGDFLPDYAGNLDIITCAGIAMAEIYAKRT